ncbi:MAG: RnfABCDGE type electron transport complex subunit D [Eubacterium sp.]|nr:RnfABCDGE type electron transport complex subunit D [Eubacterium sp.]
MYHVSVSPHVRDKSSTKSIMRDVAIALIPTLGYGVYHYWKDYGPWPLMLIFISVASCVAFEAVFEYLTKRPITVFDYSAVVTGLILAVNLPPGATWWMPVLGAAFGIIAAKLLFGGLGQNFMNPALAGRCFLMISFTQRMTSFFPADVVSAATPLAEMKGMDALQKMPLLQLFLGNHNGCIGELSALCILIGAAYLLIKKIISPAIPCVYIATTVVLIAVIRLLSGDEVTVNYLAAQLLSGGLLVGAFFMATDYVTSPITFKGKIVFGLLLGLLTALFRTLGSTAEGVSYAIIIGNLLVPIIEKKTISLPFGCERVKKVKTAKEESK